MRSQILNALKVSALAIVLSVGLGYVYALNDVPTTQPPGGNLPGFIDVGSVAQTKAGPLTVGGALTIANLQLSSGAATLSSAGDIVANTMRTAAGSSAMSSSGIGAGMPIGGPANTTMTGSLATTLGLTGSSGFSVSGEGLTGGVYGQGDSSGGYMYPAGIGVKGMGLWGVVGVDANEAGVGGMFSGRDGVDAYGVSIGVSGNGGYGVYGTAYGATANAGVGANSDTIGMYAHGLVADFKGYGGEIGKNGVWTNASDRNLKENFTPVDSQSILKKIVALPITQWNYREDKKSLHLGPVAQDFYAIFGLGENNTTISTIDPSGIALVGVKALNEKIEAQNKRIDDQQKQIDALLAEMQALKNHK